MRKEPDAESEKLGPASPNDDRPEIEVHRTYLSMANRSQLRVGKPPRVPASLVPISPCSVAQWRSLYAEIGGEWHWHDRDIWTDAQLSAHLANSSVSVYRVRAALDAETVEFAGFVEIELAADQSAEIVYLGLHSRVFGLGLGAWLVGEAVNQAFALGASRVWLHTCTLDSPAALPNYLARGFVAERVETYLTRLPG